MSKAHTPIPWKAMNHGINEPEYGHGIVHSSGGAHRNIYIEGVGKLETVDEDVTKLEANGRLILRAVNSHEAMKEALEEAVKLLDHAYHYNSKSGDKLWYDYPGVQNNARNALKLAKEGE